MTIKDILERYDSKVFYPYAIADELLDEEAFLLRRIAKLEAENSLLEKAIEIAAEALKEEPKADKLMKIKRKLRIYKEKS